MTTVKSGLALFTEPTIALFEKACAEKGIDAKTALPSVDGMPEKHQKSILAYAMLCIIIEWVNKGWVPDYHTPNRKYYTWHWVKADAERPSGFGFSLTYCVCTDSDTCLGSRLCFGSLEDEQAWQKPLEELYIAFKL